MIDRQGNPGQESASQAATGSTYESELNRPMTRAPVLGNISDARGAIDAVVKENGGKVISGEREAHDVPMRGTMHEGTISNPWLSGFKAKEDRVFYYSFVVTPPVVDTTLRPAPTYLGALPPDASTVVAGAQPAAQPIPKFCSFAKMERDIVSLIETLRARARPDKTNILKNLKVKVTQVKPK